MAQLCLGTKICIKQWLVSGASTFQYMRAVFLSPKCDNFGCLHTRQDQNELHLNRWFFFVKIGIFCKSIAARLPSVVPAFTQPYPFGGKMKLIICQIRHELSWKKNFRWRTLYVKRIYHSTKLPKFLTFYIYWEYYILYKWLPDGSCKLINLSEVVIEVRNKNFVYFLYKGGKLFSKLLPNNIFFCHNWRSS